MEIYILKYICMYHVYVYMYELNQSNTIITKFHQLTSISMLNDPYFFSDFNNFIVSHFQTLQ